ERTLSWACQNVSTSLPSASAKSSAAPIVRTQLLRLPSATRMTQTPPLLLRRYPSPRPFATRTNVGLIDTGNFNRAERVSRCDERIALALLFPAFFLATYGDKGKRRRTQKSKKISFLSVYRVRLRPLTSGFLQRISREIKIWVASPARRFDRPSHPERRPL